MPLSFQKLRDTLISGGLSPDFSNAKIRSLKIYNIIGLSVIFNIVVLLLVVLYFDDFYLAKAGMILTLAFMMTYGLGILGHYNISRLLHLSIGWMEIFYFSCIFRGQWNLQLMFFTLSVAPFMFYSWEEKKYYVLSLPPILLYLFGEWISWDMFSPYHLNFPAKLVRLFIILATSNQIISGFFYFLKQSVLYQQMNDENLHKLEVEHTKQLHHHKMSSLGEMAGGISHEINNPLQVVIGRSTLVRQVLTKKSFQDELVYKNLDKIDSMVFRIERIIKALKVFSRNPTYDQMEKVDLDELINLTLELCKERFTLANITLEVHPSHLTIFCRPTEISQVILNLLNNAFDAVKNIAEPVVKIQSRKTDGHIEILVSDNGEGISPEIKDRIMDPFFTTKEVGKGTGLGLSISKGIIESHKGTLAVLDTPENTVFQILLPQKLTIKD